ncbi:MAG: hypothetical protein SFX73_25955 [Kofleriaceae bacterium]|nr:hypothetical protein [Kofleriaceae bacterium]
MSSRLVGAIVALTAAALLAASIVTSAWWAGHPSVDGRTLTAKDVNVGLFGATGCNTGGDRKCQKLDMPGAFTATGFTELGTSSILVIALILVAVTSQTLSEKRKTIAWGAIGAAGLSTLIALAFLLQGPKVESAQHVELPIGYGTYLFFLGIVAAFVGSVLALRPAAALQPQPPRQPFAPGLTPPHAQQPPLDVLAMLQPAPPPPPRQPPAPPAFVPQPAAPPPPPPAPLPPSPGGNLPGPAGPLAGYAPRSAPPSTPPPPRAKSTSVAPTPPAAKPTTVPPVRGKSASVEPPNKPRLTPPPPKPGEIAAPRKQLLPRPSTDPLEAAMTVEHRRNDAAVEATETSAPILGEDHTADDLQTRASDSELATQARPKLSESELLEAVARESASELETIAREKLSASELSVGDSTSEHALAEPAPTAVQAAPSLPMAAVVPVSTAPASLPPPAEEIAVAAGPSPACPQCEAPMGWVEEHLRFYCKRCRMYF